MDPSNPVVGTSGAGSSGGASGTPVEAAGDQTVGSTNSAGEKKQT